MPTPLIPQEIYLLERYSSLAHFGPMRDAWAAMVKAGDDALAEFMKHLPLDYRNRPLHQQPDAVWGERVLPNLRWTLDGLNNGYLQLAAGDLGALKSSGNVLMAEASMWRDYMNDWMPEPYQTTFNEQGSLASEPASNIHFTSFGGWKQGSLTTRYNDASRGRLDPPASWPTYRLNASVKVRSGKKVPQTGIYLPEADDSCAQVMVQDHEAWDANIGYDPSTMQRFSTQATTWTLVERVADSGGGIPGGRAGTVASASGNTMRMRCEAGQPCPSEGFWFTPAKVGSRRHFKAGEVMPKFKSDYGATIWQWDQNQDPRKQ